MEKIFSKLFFVIAFFALSLNAYSASFDCKKAKSANEKLICSDEQLSLLDDEVGLLYKEAVKKSDDKKGLISNQRNAWQQREKDCSDKACLTTWYEQRKQFYSTYAVGVGAKKLVKAIPFEKAKAKESELFPENVKKTWAYKPFSIHSSKLGKDMSDTYIANKFVCKTPMATLQETMYLLQNYDLVDSQKGDGTLTITSFRGNQQGNEVVVSLAVDEQSNPRIVRYVLVEGVPALNCQ